MKITSKQLRKTWLDFYKERGHVDIGGVSLIGDGSTGVMFNVAGMQPLMPYLLGQKHPMGTRLCNVQGCVRTIDIDSVGDPTHFTFFEMMGNWSLGDYFKKEKTAWTFELLTDKLGFDKNEICATVFEGNSSAPRDEETAQLLISLGIAPNHIEYLDKSNNWWELEGTVGTPCGPDNEWFYPRHDKPCGPNCGPSCECGRYVEIGNDVYMQYEKTANGYIPLKNKNVDTGFGFERLLMFLNGFVDGYETDIFADVIALMEKTLDAKYGEDEKITKAMRIVADHIRTSVMLIGDVNGILPSNVGAGYILRRLIRRAVRYARDIGLSIETILEVAKIYIEKVYNEAYPLLVEKKDYILKELAIEMEKFNKALEEGRKEFEKTILGIEKHKQFAATKGEVVENVISGKAVFRLFDTFGFPLEITKELASERGYAVDEEGFKKAFEEHQEKSRSAAAGAFKGGLADDSYETAKLHTATHLILAGLKKMFGEQVVQKGSNITPERLRFDFNLDHKMSLEEIKTLEDFVNDAVKRELPVTFEELSLEDAKKSGAHGVFDSKYGEKVKVYVIGDVDRQICGGPHARNTKDLHHVKIVKEESSSSGIRRIKAILD